MEWEDGEVTEELEDDSDETSDEAWSSGETEIMMVRAEKWEEERWFNERIVGQRAKELEKKPESEGKV